MVYMYSISYVFDQLTQNIIFRCDCTSLNLQGCSASLQSLAFDFECKIQTRTWEVLSKGFNNLKELFIPNIPSGFIPLIMKNKKDLKVLEVGEISNKLVNIICNNCQYGLRSFLFDGGQITYSGVISLFVCKSTLQELYIRNPKYLTKYSLHILSKTLVNLR